MIRFGISGLPPEAADPEAFLDDLIARGQRAFELGFTQGFPWKERQCRRFGDAAAARGIRLSVHAPYFAILTVEDEDRSRQCVAAIEHTMKLCEELRAPIVVAHLGHIGGRSASELMDLMPEGVQQTGGHRPRRTVPVRHPTGAHAQPPDHHRPHRFAFRAPAR